MTLDFDVVFSVLIVSLATVCLLVIGKEVWKLTTDKETLAKEVATLKNCIEEGDKEIRKLTMDKETSAKEVHWVGMWKDANAQLKQLRAELKCLVQNNMVDDAVCAEVLIDIEGLKKRKGDMAKLLGMTK